MQKEKPSYYSIIIAPVRYDSRLSPAAKILYAEITSLTNENGFCHASNKYFQELYTFFTFFEENKAKKFLLKNFSFQICSLDFF